MSVGSVGAVGAAVKSLACTAGPHYKCVTVNCACDCHNHLHVNNSHRERTMFYALKNVLAKPESERQRIVARNIVRQLAREIALDF